MQREKFALALLMTHTHHMAIKSATVDDLNATDPSMDQIRNFCIQDTEMIEDHP